MYIEASAVSIRLRLDHGSAALNFVGLIDAGVNVATRPGPFPCCVVESLISCDHVGKTAPKPTHCPLPTKISKTTPCKVAWLLLGCCVEPSASPSSHNW